MSLALAYLAYPWPSRGRFSRRVPNSSRASILGQTAGSSSLVSLCRLPPSPFPSHCPLSSESGELFVLQSVRHLPPSLPLAPPPPPGRSRVPLPDAPLPPQRHPHFLSATWPPLPQGHIHHLRAISATSLIPAPPQRHLRHLSATSAISALPVPPHCRSRALVLLSAPFRCTCVWVSQGSRCDVQSCSFSFFSFRDVQLVVNQKGEKKGVIDISVRLVVSFLILCFTLLQYLHNKAFH